jgi:hypothetical protein
VHDATEVVEKYGASLPMMELHDVLRNIEYMLAPFKRYIKASKVGMAQVPLMAQAPPMAQALPMA